MEVREMQEGAAMGQSRETIGDISWLAEAFRVFVLRCSLISKSLLSLSSFPQLLFLSMLPLQTCLCLT